MNKSLLQELLNEKPIKYKDYVFNIVGQEVDEEEFDRIFEQAGPLKISSIHGFTYILSKSGQQYVIRVEDVCYYVNQIKI